MATPLATTDTARALDATSALAREASAPSRPPTALRTVLAIGNRVLREALREALTAGGAFVVGEAHTTADAVDTIIAARAEAIVLDLARPLPDLMSLLPRAREVNPAMRVVVLADQGAPVSVSRQLDVITREGGLGALLAVLGAQLTGDKPDSGVHLSVRERQILEMIAEGLTNIEIADALGISHRTVANHVARVFRKLNVRHRTHAVLAAARLGVIALRI